MTALIRYDAACRALAEAKAIDEVKDLADKAEAMRIYARQAGDTRMEEDATEIRLRAVKRFGQMEAEFHAKGPMHQGGRKTGHNNEPVTPKVTLESLGVTKRFSANAQKLAGIADRAFEVMIARKREEVASHRGRLVMDIVREESAARRKAEHAERTYTGAQVADLHALITSGYQAAAILADPPWHFVAHSEKGEGRSAAQHYTTDRAEAEQIKALPVAQLASPDCVLFMWMVDWCPKLALDVIEAWDFVHKTTAFTWAKQNASGEGWHMGQGYWTRANPEDCWLATRGHPKRINADVRQLIVHPVMEHSRKPDEIHDRIERLVDGPYLELYARRERANWVTWGNEIPRTSFPIDGAGRALDHDFTTGEIIEAAAGGETPPAYAAPASNAEPLDIPDFLCRDNAGARR